MQFTKRKIIFTILTISSAISFSNFARAETHYGFETNVPTFFLDGYHGSVWYGVDGRRARFVAAKAVYPQNMTEAGFEKKTLTFTELEFDFFFGANAKQFRGFWIAQGFGLTKQQIASATTKLDASINMIDYHFGGGYVYEIVKHVTINPWLGGDYHVISPNSVTIGNETWNPNKFDFVGGIKLGVDF